MEAKSSFFTAGTAGEWEVHKSAERSRGFRTATPADTAGCQSEAVSETSEEGSCGKASSYLEQHPTRQRDSSSDSDAPGADKVEREFEGLGLASPEGGQRPRQVDHECRAFRSWLSEQVRAHMTASQAGVLLARWFFRDKALDESDELLESFSAPFGRSGRQRDLLPLPFAAWQRDLVESLTQLDPGWVPWCKGHLWRTAQRKIVAMGAEAWAFCQQCALNLIWDKSFVSLRAPTVAQKQSLDHLFECGADFVRAADDDGHAVRCPVANWEAKIQEINVSYSGEVVSAAHWLTLEQILPGLPLDEFAASIDLASLCEGDVRRCLEDPSLVLKRTLDETEQLPHARVMCQQEEWIKICKAMCKKGLVRPLSRHELHHVNGKPLLNGAFGVEKPGKITSSGRVVLRFIMDLRPSNYLQLPIVGDIDTLAGPGKWVNLVLPKGQVIKISGDDLTAAFYLFQLPPTWHPLFAFERPCRHCDLFEGSVDTSQVWLAATVMPMGWLSAVGILQHAHRQLAVKLGRDRLPAQAEIRRDAPLPAHGVEGCSQLWHLCLDDSTFLQWFREDSTPENIAISTSLQSALRGTYVEHNIPFAQDKSLEEEDRAIRLGVELDGKRGSLGLSVEKRLEIFQLSMYLLIQEQVSRKAVQVLLGKLSHAIQFRRPIFAVIQGLWRRVTGPPTRPAFTRAERRELFIALCLLPRTCVPEFREESLLPMRLNLGVESALVTRFRV